ncbi:FUSC family protein [Streptomyces xanthophaeus]|uniref:FUSC family protein n=1 Tax=Streptomyces xanthophaeus TaxID=67385 RepID=UPI00099CD6BE|nr:FUSC family protein [Streptomyces xanthophaeus]
MGAERDGGAGRGPSVAARRAIRTTLAACAGFYVCLYGLDRPVAATYALFSAVSMAALSHIPGTGPQRAAVMARTTPAVWALLTAGTYLAVRTWTAVAGMLLIGFVLAFVAAAGPRAAGAAPGLQLLYILPCFPPYAPDTLTERLAGATLGLVLLILAEVFVLPERPSTSYRQLAAEAADTAARCAAELTRAPYTLSAESAAAARAAGEALRPFRVAEAERPAGPGLRDRALTHAGLAARTLLARLVILPAAPPGRPPPEQGPGVLPEVDGAAAETAVLLRGDRTGTQAPATAAAGALRGVREEIAAADGHPSTAAWGRRRAALLEVADATLAFSTAARLAVRGRAALAAAAADPSRFWYAGQSAPRLWWHRLAGNAGPRSVHFQNAVRISLALAAARTIAGVESLPHGFWAMLAVLSLTRTTASQTRTSVRQALAGTLLGAGAAAVVLALVGAHTTVYAVVLPIVMLVAFQVGPVRGVGWAQGMFTVVVSFAFAQLAPVTWRLAGVRLMDVVIGSLVGVVFGLLAWPRGAQDELHRAVALLLRRAAGTVESTADAVAAGGPGGIPDDRPLQHALALAESAFAQFQSEPRAPNDAPSDWQAAMMTGHHTLWGSRRLLDRAGPSPGDTDAAWLRAHGAGVAARLRDAAQRAQESELAVRAQDRAAAEVPTGAGAAAGGVPGTGSPRFFAAVAWLDSLTNDLERLATPGRPVGRA